MFTKEELVWLHELVAETMYRKFEEAADTSSPAYLEFEKTRSILFKLTDLLAVVE